MSIQKVTHTLFKMEQSILTVPYLDKHGSTFRIRTSRNLSDLKAKLVTSWSSGTEMTVSALNSKCFHSTHIFFS